MMWNIVKLNGVLSLVLVGEPIPSGAEVIGQTVDENALTSPQIPVPQVVTRFQARAALAQTEVEIQGQVINLFSAITGFMNTLPEIDLRRRAWEDALSFERHSPTVASIALLFSLTDAQVDDLFRLAATIEA